MQSNKKSKKVIIEKLRMILDDPNIKDESISDKNLIRLQYNESESQGYNYPERIIGSIRINNSKTPNISKYNIRIDTTQHAMDGFRKIIALFE